MTEQCAQACRVIGFAGGADTCKYAMDELGFDACIDCKVYPERKSLYKAIKALTPEDIDGYFENVGGMILEVVLSRMNALDAVLCAA